MNLPFSSFSSKPKYPWKTCVYLLKMFHLLFVFVKHKALLGFHCTLQVQRSSWGLKIEIKVVWICGFWAWPLPSLSLTEDGWLFFFQTLHPYSYVLLVYLPASLSRGCFLNHFPPKLAGLTHPLSNPWTDGKADYYALSICKHRLRQCFKYIGPYGGVLHLHMCVKC